jgi:hypothetical protein
MAPPALKSPLPAFAVELGVLIICASACGGGSSGGQFPVADSPVAAAAPRFAEDGHGHFLGEITAAGSTYYAEALITVDGEMRVYIGGPANALAEWRSGAGPPEDFFHPRESMLFVGAIDSVDRASASGTGTVIGQICDGASARFCGEPATADVSLNIALDDSRRILTGDLGVMAGSGEERWTIDLGNHSIHYSNGPGTALPGGGVFEERLAPFAQGEQMLLDMAPGGLLSFSSVVSGCTGDGTLLPHLDGQYDVYDVRLRIRSCNAQFAYLNSEFEGLATSAQSGSWDYDYWLVFFLAAPNGAPPRPAVTLRAYPTDP